MRAGRLREYILVYDAMLYYIPVQVPFQIWSFAERPRMAAVAVEACPKALWRQPVGEHEGNDE